MIKLRKFKILFLALNAVCVLGIFHANAMEKTSTEQNKANDVNDNLVIDQDLKYYLDYLGGRGIDPQYKIKLNDQGFLKNHDKPMKMLYLTLNGNEMFYKVLGNADPFFYNMDRSKRYYSPPAADNKYEVERHNGDLFYCYNNEKSYKLIQEGNKIYYVNVKTGERDFYSFIGKKAYYPINNDNENDNVDVLDNLPIPKEF